MLAVVVINYRNETLTRRFIEKELKKISIPYSVVVVDNGGDRTSAAALYDGMGENVYILTNPENSGFAIGNNIGARFAIDSLGADTLLFANNDIEFIDSNVVERLSQKLSELPEAGIIGPKIVGRDGKCQSPEPYMSFWDRYVWMYLSTPFLSKKKKAERFGFNYSDNASEGFHYKLMGSFFMVRAKDFAGCGMMDEATFLYAEEQILTERMARLGLKPYYYPDVCVLHAHGATTESLYKKRQLTDIQFKSECYYYRSYRNTSRFVILLGKIVYLLKSRIK